MLKFVELDHTPWPATAVHKRFIGGQVVEVPETFVVHFCPFSEEDFSAVRTDAIRTVLADMRGVPVTEIPVADIDGLDVGALPFAVGLKLNAEIFMRLVTGWEDVDLEFTPARLRCLITGPRGRAISGALNRALMELRFGLESAVEKNLPTSSMPGTDEVATAEK